jgi:DNA repair exonuclease SbcCD ATPase subunit
MIDLQTKVDRLDGFYQALKRQEDSINKEIESLKEEMDLLVKTGQVLKHLLDTMVKEDVQPMANLVSYGLKTVFDDQNLSFKPVIDRKNDKVHVQLLTLNDGLEGEFGSFGGSVAVLESFLLRIICMLKLDLARVILLDECFAAVSEEYIQNTSKLVNELCKKLGLDILLVTQNPDFTNYANRVYKAKKTPDGLILERTV